MNFEKAPDEFNLASTFQNHPTRDAIVRWYPSGEGVVYVREDEVLRRHLADHTLLDRAERAEALADRLAEALEYYVRMHEDPTGEEALFEWRESCDRRN